MKIKLDENMPASLAEELVRLGHDLDTVSSEGMGGRSDQDVWAASQTAGRFFVTQDLDFSDSRRFVPGSHHGLLLVRLATPGRLALIARVMNIFQSEQVEDWQRCFIVLTSRKVRVRRPR